MRKSGRFPTLSLLGVLLAGWLSLTCAHCWAQAPEPGGNGHCQHDLPGDTAPPCCDHAGGDGLCPGAGVGTLLIAEMNLLPGASGMDMPAVIAADLQPWPSRRASPPRLAVIQPIHPCTPLYLRHCAFLE